jgi:hypothetical protein
MLWHESKPRFERIQRYHSGLKQVGVLRGRSSKRFTFGGISEAR